MVPDGARREGRTPTFSCENRILSPRDSPWSLITISTRSCAISELGVSLLEGQDPMATHPHP